MKRPKEQQTKKVDWFVCLVMSILFGSFGVDRFMMGHIFTGIIKLLTFGGFGLWWFIDVLLIATKYNYKGVEWQDEYEKIKKNGKWNKLAIASISFFGLSIICFLLLWLVPSLVFLIPFFEIISIILGFLSLNQIKKSGEKGKRLAIISIVLGFFGLVTIGALMSIGWFWTAINTQLKEGFYILEKALID